MEQSVEDANKKSEDDVIGEKVVPSSNRGDEGIMEGVTIAEGEGEDIEEGHYSSESDEGEEGIVIHAGRTTSQRRPARKSFSKSYTRPDALSPMTPHGTAKSIKDNQQENEEDELKKLRFLRHVTAFDVDINALEDHPWRSKTVDLLDYFNYGFNERTWMQYCEKQLRLRSEKGLGPYVAPPVTTGAPLPTAAPGSSAPLAPVAPLPVAVDTVIVPSNVATTPSGAGAPPAGASTTPAAEFLPPPPPIPYPPGSFPANANASLLDGTGNQQPMPPMPPMPFPGMNPQFGMMMGGPGQFGMPGGYPGQGSWMGHHPAEEMGRDMYGRERGAGREGDANSKYGPSKRKYEGDADTSNTRRRMASNSRDRGPPGRPRDAGRDGGAREPFGRDMGAREPSGREAGAREPFGRDVGAREPFGRDVGAREPSGRDGGAREPLGGASGRDGARERDSGVRDAGARGRRDSRDREAVGRGRERDRDRGKDREKDRGSSRDGRDRAGKEKDSRENTEARRGDGSRRGGGGERERSKDRRDNKDRDRETAGNRPANDTTGRDRGKGRDRERSADRRGRR